MELKIEVKPFEVWHLSELMPEDLFYKYRKHIKLYRELGLAYSAFAMMESGEKVIGSAGLCERRPGVGELWALFSDEIKERPFFLHRKVTRMLPRAVAEMKLWRVEAYVDPRHKEHIEWIERLGFTFEGYMKNFFGEGAPGLLFAR